MRRTSQLMALGALASPAAAWLKYPFLKSGAEESWTPPQETSIMEKDPDLENQLALGWSPRPTKAPELLGRMELLPRLQGYTLGPDTCGYVLSNGNSFTCITQGATCSYSSSYIGCCEPNADCTVVKTTCMNYQSSSAGSCDLPSDFHTLCCASSEYPACFTWIFSTSSGDNTETFSLLDCSAQSGTATLLNYDPAWSATHTFGTTTSEPESTSTTGSPTTSSSEPTNTGGGGGSSTNVGAIAGGTVGGVAAIAIVALAAFLFWRRSKKNKAAAATTAPAVPPQQSPPMTQPTSPAGTYPPSSPGGAMYPSGVPSNYQPNYPQNYDPNMAAYHQQQGYQQPGYGAYSPQPQQQFQGQYDPSQQGWNQQAAYGVAAGYQPSSTGSPPPQMSPSPGIAKEGETPPPQGQHEHSAQELPAVNPLGNENNRAELG